jgi:flagellin-like hook-associated protein FlgL
MISPSCIVVVEVEMNNDTTNNNNTAANVEAYLASLNDEDYGHMMVAIANAATIRTAAAAAAAAADHVNPFDLID